MVETIPTPKTDVTSDEKQLEYEQKLATASAIVRSIAHELNTPLSAIDMGVKGAKNYFLVLLENYQLAKKNNLPGLKLIPPKHFEVLSTLFDDLEREVDFSKLFIKILIQNMKRDLTQEDSKKVQNIYTCIEEALLQYPFAYREESLVHWDSKKSFSFIGSDFLIIYVLFNLLKNSLYQIAKAGKGRIQLWQTIEHNANVLHFKDTATGIPEDIKSTLFQPFASNRQHGIGLGLAFCNKVMQKLGGSIECCSVEGEYTEFLLYVPPIKKP
jgi:signal transduction histidine kinase